MSFRKPVLVALILLTGGMACGQTTYSAGDIVNDFTLVNRATNQNVDLHDFEGKVIFLEWFAHWCPFCRAAAAQVKTGIVDHYKASGGKNPNGVPVMHVGVNLQGNAETQTQRFIDSYGIGYVLNDFNRSVAKKFFPSGRQPIFAIINGVKNSPSHKQWELVYSLENYGRSSHPISTFRLKIDSVQAESTDPPPPTPEVTIAGGNTITEGGSASFTLTATPAPSSSLDVSVSISDDAASDFVASGKEGARTVTIPTTGTVSFTVSTENDEVDEANGSVSATVNSGSGYTVGTPSSATVTVNDDDDPPPPPTPEVTITGGNTITEGGNASFTLTARPAPSSSLDVSVSVSDDAASDFVASDKEGSRTVTISTSGMVSFTVSTENDEVDEANGSVSATVNSGSGYTVGTPSSATVTVNDDDDPPPPPTPEVTITGGNTITEGGNASFTLTARPAPSSSLDVSVSVSDDAASDFVASGKEGPRTVTIPTTGTVSFTVSTENDEVDEANGSVSATVNSGSGYTVGTPSSATVTVNDDDDPPPPPTPEVTITGGNTITEGGNASFTLTARPAPSSSLDVSVSVSDDAASDFVASGKEGPRTVTIPTTGTVSFTVSTENDEVDEANGSVSATVNSGSGYTVGTPSSATVTVNDDDDPPPPPTPPLPPEYMNYLSNQGIPESQLQQDLDPDSDGVPNVFEYYFGTDASDTASFSQPTPIIVRISSTPYNALQYVRNPDAVGVTISVEFSYSPSFDSLIGSVPFSNQPLENGLEEVVVRSKSPLSGREFSRLIYRSEDL